MLQLDLALQSDKDTLQSYLEKATGKSISLIITDNNTSMLSFRDGKNIIKLRLHRMFLVAEFEVLDELADFMKSRRKKTPLIRKFIAANMYTVKRKAPNKIIIQPRGRFYDLATMYESVNMEYFQGKVSAVITWGARRPRRAAARTTLGSYSSLNNTIRINPALDAIRVPRYFVEFIVYHEMLHADIGIENGKKRRIIHSKEFKRREKLFKHYERALSWEKRRL